MGKIRVVLVGCGGISAAWLRPAVKEKDLEIVGLVDLNRKAAENQAAQFRLKKALVGTNFKEMLRQTKPDAVFDCTVPEAHFEITMESLKAGCHVLGEKPLADSMEHAQEMVTLARKTGRIFAVIQNRRYYNYVRGVEQFLRAKKIGSLTGINSDFYIGAHFGGFRDRMRHVLLLDMAIHTFDTARFISGADPVSVYCQEWNPAGSWYDHGASAVAIFEMTDGIVYSYRGSWCAEGLNTTWASTWRIMGTRGSATWNGEDDFRAQRAISGKGFLRKQRNLRIAFPAKKPEEEGHGGLIKDFLRAIRTGKKPLTDCTDNIKSLAMVFAAIESSEKKRVIKIR